jgi:hypothetical protein
LTPAIVNGKKSLAETLLEIAVGRLTDLFGPHCSGNLDTVKPFRDRTEANAGSNVQVEFETEAARSQINNLLDATINDANLAVLLSLKDRPTHMLQIQRIQ